MLLRTARRRAAQSLIPASPCSVGRCSNSNPQSSGARAPAQAPRLSPFLTPASRRHRLSCRERHLLFAGSRTSPVGGFTTMG